MPVIDPLHTTVEKTTQTMLGTVVLEDPKGFPREESNLYCVGHDGEMVWKAEKPEPSGLYSRVMLDTETETLSAYAVTGQACEIELMTGKLISQVKIK
jgi:hypothetical protein